MGTLSLRNGPLLTQPQAGIEHGLPLATSIQVQLHHQGPDFKLGCAGWETFKSRRSVTSTRARTAARGTRASIGFTADPRVKCVSMMFTAGCRIHSLTRGNRCLSDLVAAVDGAEQNRAGCHCIAEGCSNAACVPGRPEGCSCASIPESAPGFTQSGWYPSFTV